VTDGQTDRRNSWAHTRGAQLCPYAAENQRIGKTRRRSIYSAEKLTDTRRQRAKVTVPSCKLGIAIAYAHNSIYAVARKNRKDACIVEAYLGFQRNVGSPYILIQHVMNITSRTKLARHLISSSLLPEQWTREPRYVNDSTITT